MKQNVVSIHDFSSSCIRRNRSTDTSCNQVEYVPKLHYQTLSFTAAVRFNSFHIA